MKTLRDLAAAAIRSAACHFPVTVFVDTARIAPTRMFLVVLLWPLTWYLFKNAYMYTKHHRKDNSHLNRTKWVIYNAKIDDDSDLALIRLVQLRTLA